MIEDKTVTIEKPLVVLFSGGVHSSLAVSLMASRHNPIVCLTLKRFGIYDDDQIADRVVRLKKRFPATDIRSVVLPFDDEYKALVRRNRFRLMSMSLCGLCKLAMHWRTLRYCREQKIENVCDKAESSMVQYPDQNEGMLLGLLRGLYPEFGVSYETPVFHSGDKAEHTLYRMGVTSKRNIRGTSDDRQIVCTQQRMFKFFVDYYVGARGWDAYVADTRRFYAEQVDFVRESLGRDDVPR
ncbi:MAG TPA: hypothetical protein PK876_00710 [Elusimicrobiota bacterium]|nr:hypothetical protein [Elusimicrobiota bacterium]